MSNKITATRLVVADCLKIEIDRILIFVESISEIEAFRKLHLHYFEFAMHHSKQGTVSSIFFFKDVNLELVWIENLELALRYTAQNNLGLVSRIQQRQGVVPFAFILSYLSSQKSESKRRCYHIEREIESERSTSQVNFSLKNLLNLQEPACYIVPESLTSENLLDSSSVIQRNLLSYRSKTSRLTDIRITLNSPQPLSNAISLIVSLELIKVKPGKFPLLELIFNNSFQRQFTLKLFSGILVNLYY